MPTSPNSFSITAIFLPCCSFKIRFSKVLSSKDRTIVNTYHSSWNMTYITYNISIKRLNASVHTDLYSQFTLYILYTCYEQMMHIFT